MFCCPVGEDVGDLLFSEKSNMSKLVCVGLYDYENLELCVRRGTFVCSRFYLASSGGKEEYLVLDQAAK